MDAKQPAEYLWRNICALLGVGVDSSIDSVHKALKSKGAATIGRGTVQRIKEREGHRATDVLAEVASALGVEVWQLLVPELDAAALPELRDRAAERKAEAYAADEAFLIRAYRHADKDARQQMLRIIAAAYPRALAD